MRSHVKNIIIVLLVIVLGVFIFIRAKKDDTTGTVPVVEDTTKEGTQTEATSFEKQDIKSEKNFTGKRLVIKGTSPVAVAAQQYVDSAITEFKKQADVDVPDIIKEFGINPSSPAYPNYSIEFDGKEAKSDMTESIIVSQYIYTGGANGMSSYKVFTNSRATGKALPLSSVIKEGQRDAFVTYVKNALTNWRPEGMSDGGSVVFPQEVAALTFNSFQNWSLDNKNLILYFDKYEIGPGALGAVAFPLPLSKVQSFMNQ
jgi:hypothetical protein